MVHDIPEKSVVFEKDMDRNVDGKWGTFLNTIAICSISNAYIVFKTLLPPKERPVRHKASPYNETGMVL